MNYSDFEKITFDNMTDFNPVHIFECGQVFRWLPEEGSDGNAYRGAAGCHAARACFENDTLTLEVTGGDREYWHNYFDLSTDYSQIKKKLAESEPAIKPATEYGSGIRILNQDLFETVISFIISQNNNIPRIRKCIEALCERYGNPIGEIEGGPVYAFPTPEVLAAAKPEDIAELKLGYRSTYIVESARQYVERGEPTCRDDLLGMQGIGPKVANCIMLFGLRDVTAFPIDTWVRHIMNDMYGFDEKDAASMERFAQEKFSEYAGYAQQYLFYYYRDKATRRAQQ